MSALRPETVLRRKLELQIGVRYQIELLELRTKLAQTERELAEERRKGIARAERCACPGDVPHCECSWCQMAAEAAALCPNRQFPANQTVPDRAFVSPLGVIPG